MSACNALRRASGGLIRSGVQRGQVNHQVVFHLVFGYVLTGLVDFLNRDQFPRAKRRDAIGPDA
jgi:hypothetical protein